jgi:hypothetical protein
MFSVARLGLLLAAACSGKGGPGGPNETTMVPDSGPAGPFDITIASSPPIELPGTVLWLDADFGVARDGAQVRAWTDRSGLGHVVEREAVGDPGPTSDRLAGHGAVRFGGHVRMGLSRTVEDRARAALTIGAQDFLIALVLRHDGGGPEPTLFALAAPEAASPVVRLQLAPTLQFVLGEAAPLDTPATLDGARPRLVVALRQGGVLVVRVDGVEVGNAPAAAAELPFLVPFVGGWALEPNGFAGLVGDVVMVAGPAVEADVAPLEAYLQQKYGI